MDTMSSQLNNLKDKLVTKKNLKEPKKSPMNLGVDGVDHINIWEHGDTELGKFLAHGTRNPVDHHVYGRFETIESFWKYIRSEERDDRLRGLSGVPLRKFSDNLTTRRVPNFKIIIMGANYQKIIQHPDMVLKIKESELPFDSYYLKKNNELRVRPTFFNWFVAGMEEIRTAIKEDRKPVLDFLLEGKRKNITDSEFIG